MSSFDSFNYSRPNYVKYKHKKENITSILGLVAAPYETPDEEEQPLKPTLGKRDNSNDFKEEERIEKRRKLSPEILKII